jgi:hypothetical protein
MKYTVNTMEKCTRFLDKFRSNGWKVWQMQFRWNDEKEGFHAWFMKAGEQDIEIVTYNEEVEKAIVRYEP